MYFIKNIINLVHNLIWTKNLTYNHIYTCVYIYYMYFKNGEWMELLSEKEVTVFAHLQTISVLFILGWNLKSSPVSSTFALLLPLTLQRLRSSVWTRGFSSFSVVKWYLLNAQRDHSHRVISLFLTFFSRIRVIAIVSYLKALLKTVTSKEFKMPKSSRSVNSEWLKKKVEITFSCPLL